MSIPYPPQTPAAAPTCYRHPDRRPTSGARGASGLSVRSACTTPLSATSAWTVSSRCRRRCGLCTTLFGGRRTGDMPVVTYTLIAINVLMFVLQTVASAGVERQLVLWPPAVADGEVYRSAHVGVPTFRRRPHPVQHVGTVGGGAAAGDGVGPVPVHFAVPAERARRCRCWFTCVTLNTAHRRRVRRGVRVVRCDVRGRASDSTWMSAPSW